MVACLSPSDAYLEENISTLRYAVQASKIQNAPTIHEDPRAAKIRELTTKCASLQKQLDDANKHISLLTELGGGAQSVSVCSNCQT